MWLLVFFFIPIVEMYLLIEVGGYIGAWPTIGLVMLTAVIGVTLLRIQGLATLTRGLARLNRGELPATEVVEGLLLAVAGALLLTPGFVTDAVGFLLLLPPTRLLVAERVLTRVRIVAPGPEPGGRPGPGRSAPAVIEGEFEAVEPAESPERAADAGEDPRKP